MTGREEFDVGIADASGATDGARCSPTVWDRAGSTPGGHSCSSQDRDFTWADREGAPGVVIVNQTLAQQFWNGVALGQHVVHNRQQLEVVGVVRDSKDWTLGKPLDPPSICRSGRGSRTT